MTLYDAIQHFQPSNNVEKCRNPHFVMSNLCRGRGEKVTVHTGGPIWRENTVEEFFLDDLRIDRNWLKNGAKVQNLVKF